MGVSHIRRRTESVRRAVIAMLRAVNVGGRNKIAMEDLRALCSDLGLSNPKTYIQSGNVAFGTAEPDLARLARRIEDEMERRCAFRTVAILRTASDLRSVIAANPFAARAGIEPNKLHVTFLAADPGPEICGTIRAIPTDPEELHIAGREMYCYFPNGAGQSKLPTALIERTLRTPGTARNWNTVLKLLEMAETSIL